MKFYDSMGFESEHGIYARRADVQARIGMMGDRIEQLELELAHKEAYYAQFTLVPKSQSEAGALLCKERWMVAMTSYSRRGNSSPELWAEHVASLETRIREYANLEREAKSVSDIELIGLRRRVAEIEAELTALKACNCTGDLPMADCPIHGMVATLARDSEMAPK